MTWAYGKQRSGNSRQSWKIHTALSYLILWPWRAVRLLSFPPSCSWVVQWLSCTSLLCPMMETPKHLFVGKWLEIGTDTVLSALTLLVLWPIYYGGTKVISLLTSESISIATGAGRWRGALWPDDRGKGTLLFDSRKNWRGKWEDGGRARRSNSGTWWHDWKANAQSS